MKRFRRILFNTLMAISLLLAIATAGLWVRSGFFIDYGHVTRISNGSELQVDYISESGRFGAEIEYDSSSGTRITYFRWFRDSGPAGRKGILNRFLPDGPSFEFVSKVFGAGEHREMRLVVRAPYWFMLAVSAMPFTAHTILFFMQRHKKSLINCCPACGYDTRANPAKCSECGHETKNTVYSHDPGSRLEG